MEYLFTLLIPIVAVTIVVILAKHIASHTFKCKHCSKEFHIKWSNQAFRQRIHADMSALQNQGLVHRANKKQIIWQI